MTQPMPNFTVRTVDPDDRTWIAAFVSEHWCTDIVVVHSRVYRPDRLRGFVAESGSNILGLLTYNIDGFECEIVTLNSVLENQGVGTRLVRSVEQVSRQEGCRRLWLVTTNDNLNALRFYQKRGFTLAAIRPDMVKESRKIKPEIPPVGMNGIPIRDEIELEMKL